MTFFATASRGTEAVLAAELREIGVSIVREERGGVAFEGGIEEAYRTCLWSRTASRVLMVLGGFEAEDADTFYQGVHEIDWSAHLDPSRTLAVDVAGRDAPAGPPHFLTLKAKDAIVDRVRERAGTRPDVDTRDPDLRINLHLSGSRVTVHLDLGGGALHRRGGPRSGADAPLKENLAAAILRIAGWRCADPRGLFDPMCGSGTLLVEAMGIALDAAPGLVRGRFGAAGWRGHDAELWRSLRAEARERASAAAPGELRIAGADASRDAVWVAREQLSRAGGGREIRVNVCELRDAAPPWDDPGLLVTNPPYGERLGRTEELVPMYELLGDVMKRRFPGWGSWILCGNPALAKRIGLRPKARHVLFNGPIECRLLEIPISAAAVAGSSGPGWRRPSDEAKPFSGKLRKNLRDVRKWARREKLSCYRIYDSDVPEYNLAVDWYDGTVVVCEHERPRKIPAATAERRLRDAMLAVPEVLEVEAADVILRVAPSGRPGRTAARRKERKYREILEAGSKFLVDLTHPPDGGLALGERGLRQRMREQSRGRDLLQLFAGTCASSVAAAAGGAKSTTAIDGDETLLAWGQRSFRANGWSGAGHVFVADDPLRWLERGDRERRYDLILAGPPETDSRFDVERDHVRLLSLAARRLAPGGEILLVTRRRRFRLDGRGVGFLEGREITVEVTPRDFERRPALHAWAFRKR